MRLATARWTPFRGWQGQAYTMPVNKVLLHRTQGSTALGAFSVYANRMVEPHFTIDASPAVNQAWQHVDTDRASWAIREHDADGVIQVEIVGFSERAHEWGPTEYRNLANFLRPVVVHHRIPLTSTVERPWPATGDDGYGEDADARLTADQFHAYSGFCGHVHAPDNSHWDPGNFNIQALLDELRGTTTQPKPPTEDEDEMPRLFAKHKNDATVFAIWDSGKVRIMGPAEMAFYKRREPSTPLITTANTLEKINWRKASRR